MDVVDAPVLKLFRDGLSRDHIVSLFEKESILPSDDLMELYEWKNGLNYKDIPVGMLCFGVDGVFFPLQESLRIYQMNREDNLDDYFPVFSDDSFIIQLNRDSPDFGKIFIYSPSLLIIEPQSYFDSLASMIDTFLACFRQGAFSYSEGWFERDYDKSYAIAKKINPGSAYWN